MRVGLVIDGLGFGRLGDGTGVLMLDGVRMGLGLMVPGVHVVVGLLVLVGESAGRQRLEWGNGPGLRFGLLGLLGLG